jgi:hypothetical protein
MYCPKCGTEYREGFPRCADCDIDLVSEKSPEPGDQEEHEFVILKTYASRHEAELGKGILSVNGIDGFIFADDYGGINPGLSFSTGVRLVVKKRDAEKALDILHAANDDPDLAGIAEEDDE